LLVRRRSALLFSIFTFLCWITCHEELKLESFLFLSFFKTKRKSEKNEKEKKKSILLKLAILIFRYSFFFILFVIVQYDSYQWHSIGFFAVRMCKWKRRYCK
jgi:amino acid permease